MARETWYVLEDGRVADPGDCIMDAKGVLTHISGVKVAMRLPDCPLSRGVDADAERAKAADAKAAELKATTTKPPGPNPPGPNPAAKDMKPEEPKRGYRTRESKAD